MLYVPDKDGTIGSLLGLSAKDSYDVERNDS